MESSSSKDTVLALNTYILFGFASFGTPGNHISEYLAKRCLAGIDLVP